MPTPTPPPKPNVVPVPVLQPPDGVISSTEHTALRTFLTTAGCSSAQCDAAVGATPGTNTRRQIEAKLTSWLATRPKG